MARILIPTVAIGLGTLSGAVISSQTHKGYTTPEKIGTVATAIVAGAGGLAAGVGAASTHRLANGIAGAIAGVGLVVAVSLTANLNGRYMPL